MRVTGWRTVAYRKPDDVSHIVVTEICPQRVVVRDTSSVVDTVDDRILLALLVIVIVTGVDVEISSSAKVLQEVGQNRWCGVVAPVPISDEINIDAMRIVHHRSTAIIDAVVGRLGRAGIAGRRGDLILRHDASRRRTRQR